MLSFVYRASLWCLPIIFLTLNSFCAWGDPAGDTSLLPPELWQDSTNTNASVVDFLKLQNSQYVNSGKAAFRPGASTQNSSALLGIDNQGEIRKGILGRVDVSDEYSATEQWNYFDVYDLEASAQLGEATRLSVGRKLIHWSDWDSRWQQGGFQSRYMENGLRARDAGLTGLFLQTHNEHWDTTLALLPIFIPDFGPHFSVQNNVFASQNPWFRPPASEFQLANGSGDIHYSLDENATNAVIGHPGLASKVEYHDGGYSSRLSYAYKPLSNVLLAFPSNGYLTGPNYMQLTIIPRVVYDRIVSWDNAYASGPWQISGSVAVDDPVQDRGPSEWTAQQISSATIVSGAVSRRVEEAGPHAARVEIAFLKVNGGDDADTGFFANPTATRFARRFQFYEAYSVAVQKEFRSAFFYPLNNELRIIYDRVQEGGAITFTSEARINANWRADLEVDIIGLLTSTGDVSDGFLSNFRANNRVGLGASYVF